MFMNSIFKKFISIFKRRHETFINVDRVYGEYKKMVGNSEATRESMIRSLKLDYVITGIGRIHNIKIDSDQFDASTMKVFVKMSQLSRSKELIKRVKNLPEEVHNYDDSECDSDEYE